ncbi:MAG: ATPase [Chloroflexi bacterium CFX4]|nr:ATPase [Chloroflexi bacterium CFX4]MDL1923492.1 ATPase [Chloroflexi bacterium CFX3]
MSEIRISPRIEGLTIKNYRALRDVTLADIQPLSVFIGANGSGKSTFFDVFAFLAECFQVGLRKAWDKRGRFRELRSRGSHEPIEIELVYREYKGAPKITYHLTIDERDNRPFVAEEWLQWRRKKKHGLPFKFLNFQNGQGSVISGEQPEESDTRTEERLESPELIAVNTLGQLARNPRVAALRRFISGWYLSYLSADSARTIAEAGAQERLSQTGDNLPNVIQYLKEQHPAVLRAILEKLAARVPRLERVDADVMPDGRLLLQIKDAPFQEPILARFASDGTLKLLAYLIVLNDPQPPPLVGIEEPENYLHHRLLPILAEECRIATETMQLMVTTHSPFFADALRPKEIWVLERGQDGYTQAMNAAKMDGITEHIEAGAKLGELWSANYFSSGDPLYQGEAL